jgi:hypothetical protein
MSAAARFHPFRTVDDPPAPGRVFEINQGTNIMSKYFSSSIAAALLVLVLAMPAQALSNRAWVSGHGADVAGCGSPASACRTFQYVHDNIIAAGGEIDVLDPAGFGPVTITKALSIVNDGVGTAGVQQAAVGQNAITINAGASDAVFLRGLNIDGLGTGGNGIRLNSGGKLTVVDCVTRHFNASGGGGFTGNGIEIVPSSGATKVSISNTIASDNIVVGILFHPTGSGSVIGVISQTTAANNFTGIDIENSGAGASATIVDSIDFNNSSIGVFLSAMGASMRIDSSVVTGNGTGVSIGFGATASSYGDNKIDGNTTNVSGTLAIIANH